jgi:hypothetical protein
MKRTLILIILILARAVGIGGDSSTNLDLQVGYNKEYVYVTTNKTGLWFAVLATNFNIHAMGHSRLNTNLINNAKMPLLVEKVSSWQTEFGLQSFGAYHLCYSGRYAFITNRQLTLTGFSMGVSLKDDNVISLSVNSTTIEVPESFAEEVRRLQMKLQKQDGDLPISGAVLDHGEGTNSTTP